MSRNWVSLLSSYLCCTSTENEELEPIDLDPYKALYDADGMVRETFFYPNIEEGQLVNPIRQDRQFGPIATPRLEFLESYAEDRQVGQVSQPSSPSLMYKQRQDEPQPQEINGAVSEMTETIVNPFGPKAQLPSPTKEQYERGMVMEMQEIKPRRTMDKSRKQNESQPQAISSTVPEKYALCIDKNFLQDVELPRPSGIFNKNFFQAVELPPPSDSLGLNVRHLDTIKPAEDTPETISDKGARPKTVKKSVRFLLHNDDDTEKVHKKIKRIKKNTNNDYPKQRKVKIVKEEKPQEKPAVFHLYQRCYVGDIDQDLYV